ncbi:protein phosphatase 1 regulatory subunit 14A isoform X1 [Cervus canadensis]|uniref:protein phosphatase 1 regulatory subunit 14A isoform X1 n=1 Tax=Cervus canadensis TaxID=1574408 RepID=UPI001CA3344C|nr:protein phosphatase 1 regulatory subunit 14A isoform X1 [Cervus canadensis]
MAAQRLGKRVLSKLQAPSRARGPGGSPGGLQKRHARVTVKYDRRELQRRLDVEKWIDGRLEELYRGREADMPDEVNIDELLELESEEERSRKIQGLLKSCTNPTEVSFLSPTLGPVLSPAPVGVGVGGGLQGGGWKLVGPAEGTLGALPVPGPFSHLSGVFCLPHSCPLNPHLPPRGLHYLPLLRRSPICLLSLPLSPVPACSTLGLPSPPLRGPPDLPGPERPSPSHFLPGFKRENYSCFSDRLWAARGTNVTVYLSALELAEAAGPWGPSSWLSLGLRKSPMSPCGSVSFSVPSFLSPPLLCISLHFSLALSPVSSSPSGMFASIWSLCPS